MTTITINDPNTEGWLKQGAQAAGLSLESYVLMILQQYQPAAYQAPAPMTEEEFEQWYRDLTKDSDKLPILAPEATTRAGIYADHD